jgi:urease accessory protein UreE
MNSKNAKFNHVFAIIRLDTFQEGASVEEKMTIPKVVLTQETAEKEVERLNELNGSKGAFYFWQMTRLEICPDNSLTTCSEN